MKAKRLLLGLCVGMSIMLGVQAAYPERPITIVVPFPAGGSTDAIARAVGAKMSACPACWVARLPPPSST